MMRGGFKLVTKGDSSRQGEVSLELAVLDPFPPTCPGDCIAGVFDIERRGVVVIVPVVVDSSEETISESPKAEALFTTDRDLFLQPKGGDDMRLWEDGDDDVSWLKMNIKM